jgi:hypothetical protein
VQFAEASQSGSEGSGFLSITALLSTVSGRDVTLPFAVTGAATGGIDYSITDSPITIPAGSMTGTITITIIDDLLDEVDEPVIVTFGTPSHATPGAITVHTATIRDNEFLAAVYVDLLGRPNDVVGLSVWSASLDRGDSRSQVVLAIEQAPEAWASQTQGYYQRFLGRAADSFGLNVFVSALQNGTMRAEDVIATIVGSPEYLARVGGTSAAFLSRTYLDLLGRPIDSFGQPFWSGALTRGSSRTQVARAILQTPEGRQAALQGFYQRFLGRAADPFGLGLFAEQLRLGMTYEQVGAQIVGSPEYFERHAGRPATNSFQDTATTAVP